MTNLNLKANTMSRICQTEEELNGMASRLFGTIYEYILTHSGKH